MCPCGVELPTKVGRGRPASYCSNACRQRAYRARQVPAEMRGRRWVRCVGKRPVRVNGRPASSTDPATWSRFETVRDSGAGNGFGVMLGGGLGCYDLDHVSDEQVRAFARAVPERILLVERSMSGEGAHIFVVAPEDRGWRRTVDGLSVERYTRERFIRTTLERITI